MKKLIVAITATFLIICARAQEPVKPASMGFDTVRSNIAHGRIDTITYTSKTVDTKRRALVYTPP
ncbi:MAG TPA: hypothetical protein VM935_00050, partial [Chitinophagaceae bacterium]|nr:hypothetical protein [Chitinophagaceae bacterium]